MAEYFCLLHGVRQGPRCTWRSCCCITSSLAAGRAGNTLWKEVIQVLLFVVGGSFHGDNHTLLPRGLPRMIPVRDPLRGDPRCKPGGIWLSDFSRCSEDHTLSWIHNKDWVSVAWVISPVWRPASTWGDGKQTRKINWKHTQCGVLGGEDCTPALSCLNILNCTPEKLPLICWDSLMSSQWMILFLKACSLSGWKWLALNSIMNLGYLGLFCGLALGVMLNGCQPRPSSGKHRAFGEKGPLWLVAIYPPCCLLQPVFPNAAPYLGCLPWLTQKHTFWGPCAFTPFHVRNLCNIWYPCTAFGNVGTNFSVIQLPLTPTGESTSGVAYGNWNI